MRPAANNLIVFLLFLLLATPFPAQASVKDCAELAGGAFNVSDVKKAYTFISQHGECIGKFTGDNTFQVLTGALFALKASKAISSDTCTAVLNVVESDAANTLISIAGGDYVQQNISCGCAVIYSGVDTKLKQIVEKIKACGEAFNPAEWVSDGLDKASGAVEGLGGVLGIGGKYAEGPNGGAPTSYYICSTVGKWLAYEDRGPDHACDCPKLYKMEWGNGINGPVGSMRCIADCPKDQILKNGVCQTCPSAGANTETHPDETGLECLTMGWGVGCGSGKKPSGDGKGCLWACPMGEVWDDNAKTCNTCPAGHIAQYKSGMGSIGDCKPCPEGTQPISNACKPCPEGSKWQAPGFCVGAFPGKACGPNEIKDAMNPQGCKTCPREQHPNSQHTVCIPFSARLGAPDKAPHLSPLSPKKAPVRTLSPVPAPPLAPTVTRGTTNLKP